MSDQYYRLAGTVLHRTRTEFKIECVHPAEADKVVAALNTIEQQQAEIKELREALFFYADPETYIATALLPDSPCGDIVNDYSDTKEPFGVRLGKRARLALGIDQWDEDGKPITKQAEQEAGK